MNGSALSASDLTSLARSSMNFVMQHRYEIAHQLRSSALQLHDSTSIANDDLEFQSPASLYPLGHAQQKTVRRRSSGLAMVIFLARDLAIPRKQIYEAKKCLR